MTKSSKNSETSTTIMNTENKTMTIIKLQEIASQLAQTAKSIQEKVKDSDDRFDIYSDMLIKKIPELKNFNKGTVIFQARWDKESSIVRIEIPKVCKSYENEKVVVQLPDLDYLDNFEYVSYVCGIGGYAVIKVGDSDFQIGLTANLDLEDGNLENTDGMGEPPTEVLDFEKRPEIPLKSDLIPLNEEIIVISNGKYSREYSTALCNIKITSTGKVLKNVITNSALERLIKKYGSNGETKFKVTSKTVNKKDKSKTDVAILDLNGIDFSDLEL